MVLNIIKKINDNYKNSNILILVRYNEDIDFLIDKVNFKKGNNDKIICVPYSNLKIDYLTVHSSKGLGYDNVILINAINDKYGFPSKIIDHPIIDILNDKTDEKIEYPEERRLLYVALTRTKNNIYIVAPFKPYSKRSSFVNEIVNNYNVEEVFNKI